jgi:hypothetical protein
MCRMTLTGALAVSIGVLYHEISMYGLNEASKAFMKAENVPSSSTSDTKSFGSLPWASFGGGGGGSNGGSSGGGSGGQPPAAPDISGAFKNAASSIKGATDKMADKMIGPFKGSLPTGGDTAPVATQGTSATALKDAATSTGGRSPNSGDRVNSAATSAASIAPDVEKGALTTSPEEQRPRQPALEQAQSPPKAAAEQAQSSPLSLQERAPSAEQPKPGPLSAKGEQQTAQAAAPSQVDQRKPAAEKGGASDKQSSPSVTELPAGTSSGSSLEKKGSGERGENRQRELDTSRWPSASQPTAPKPPVTLPPPVLPPASAQATPAPPSGSQPPPRPPRPPPASQPPSSVLPAPPVPDGYAVPPGTCLCPCACPNSPQATQNPQQSQKEQQAPLKVATPAGLVSDCATFVMQSEVAQVAAMPEDLESTWSAVAGGTDDVISVESPESEPQNAAKPVDDSDEGGQAPFNAMIDLPSGKRVRYLEVPDVDVVTVE